MSSNSIRVITYGTFDLLHRGHIRLLERARALGDELIVGLSTDEFNLTKGKASVVCYEDRRLILEQLRIVDKVIPEESWGQKETDIKRLAIGRFVIGDDWQGKFDHLRSLCEVVYLPRTPGICTSDLKLRLSKLLPT